MKPVEWGNLRCRIFITFITTAQLQYRTTIPPFVVASFVLGNDIEKWTSFLRTAKTLGVTTKHESLISSFLQALSGNPGKRPGCLLPFVE